MSTSSVYNLLSALLAGWNDHRRSILTTIDQAIAVIVHGVFQSSPKSTIPVLHQLLPPPPPPPPPTRTVPWPIPGTKTLSNPDYAPPSTLWIIIAFFAMAIMLLAVPFLQRFGVEVHLVRLVSGAKSRVRALFAIIIVFISVVLDIGSSNIQTGFTNAHAAASIALRTTFARLKTVVVFVPVLADSFCKKHHLRLRLWTSEFYMSLKYTQQNAKLLVNALLLFISHSFGRATTFVRIYGTFLQDRFNLYISKSSTSINLFIDSLYKRQPRQDPDPPPGLDQNHLADDPHDIDSFWHPQRLQEVDIPGFNCTIDPNVLRSVQLLGKGGFGTVWKMEEENTGRVFAVKVMLDDSDRDTIPPTVWSEVDVPLRLANNPAVPTVHGVFYDDEAFFVVLDCGVYSFFDLMEGQALTRADALFFGAELLVALQAMHRQGVVHRDLKSDNLLVGPDGHLLLIDFGISRFWDIEQPRWPWCSAWWHRLCGTDDSPPLWPDPENPYIDDTIAGTEGYQSAHIQLKEPYSFGADLWSFGAVMHEWLTGGWVPDYRIVHCDDGSARVEWIPNPNVDYDDVAADFFFTIFDVTCGCRFETYEELKKHPIWSATNWKAHQRRRVPPPSLAI